MNKTALQFEHELKQLIKYKTQLHNEFEKNLITITQKLQQKDQLSTQEYVDLVRKKNELILEYEQNLIETITRLKDTQREYIEYKLEKSRKKYERGTK